MRSFIVAPALKGLTSRREDRQHLVEQLSQGPNMHVYGLDRII
jgi:hypothetical protein